MVCCVAVGFVVAFAVRLWRLVTLQPVQKASMFPPVARRTVVNSMEPLSLIADINQASSPFTTRALLLFYAFCIALYILAVEAFVASGIVAANDHQDGFYRYVLYLGLIAYFVVLCLLPSKKKILLTAKQFYGSMLTITGIVFIALTITDAHLFQVVDFFHGGHAHHDAHTVISKEYVMLHGVGVLPIFIGQYLFNPAKNQ